MPRITTGLIALLLVAGGTTGETVDYPNDLAKWVESASHPIDWIAANNDTEHRWVVFLRGGRPCVRLRRQQKGSPYPERQESYPPMPFVVEQGSMKDGLAGEWFSAEVPDGWIIAFNKGEWGGGVWWFSPDGKRRYKISKDQVCGFLQTEAGLLALEGVAHGGFSVHQGQLIRLTQGADGRWRSEHFADLKGAPDVAAREASGSYLIVTYDCLLRFHPTTRKLEVLVDDAFWHGLYPTSMIIAPTGEIYIGMRHGVAKVEKRGKAYQAQWLIPNAEFDRPLPEELR